jgi:hypothetical protein
MGVARVRRPSAIFQRLRSWRGTRDRSLGRPQTRPRASPRRAWEWWRAATCKGRWHRSTRGLRRRVIAERGTCAGDLVGRNAHTGARPTAEHAVFGVAVRDRSGNLAGDRGPRILAIARKRTEAANVVIVPAQPTLDRLGKFAGHIAAQCNSHRKVFCESFRETATREQRAVGCNGDSGAVQI